MLENLPSEIFDPTHFSKRIVPQLREVGISDDQIDRLVVDDPRRFLEGEKLAALA